MGRHDDSIGRRKTEHLEICADPSAYSVEGDDAMFGELRFVHRTLPEIDESDVDTTTEFLGRTISMPLFISCMTGGSDEGYRVNRILAEVGQRAGIPVGTGSIRILFRKPEVIDHFRLRKLAPDVPLFANIGGVQLREPIHDRLVELIRELEVDAIAVHLNAGQELAQPEGDRGFAGIADGISRLCDVSPVPVIVKETGFGIAPHDARDLLDRGVRYVDVAGSGGTNWMTVEGYRLDPAKRAVAAEFADWGIPTALCLAASRDLGGSILASGGIRTGMDVARSISLGAVAAGLALPFVREVVAGGIDAASELAERLRAVLRTVMVLTASRTIDELRAAPLIESDRFRSMTAALVGRGNQR